MTTIHLVSHTHWDREWYQPFQIFRLRLVHLIDTLLDLMDNDPEFKHFTLDGQTIVLEDYLQMRPEREEKLSALIKSGRLLVGPWHILPDEFLVSPEATIRNLLQGDRTARRFGPKMQVGYIPDPFGHIGQMPQILNGFGITTASVGRGLDDQPAELWWEAPDGSRVYLAYLRDSYGSAAMLPADRPDDFVREVASLRDSLLPHTVSGHVLLMHGTDHTVPPPETSQAIAYASGCLDGDRLVHSTLPAFIAQAQAEIARRGIELPVVHGELRSPKRFHLLPGVLSARMWIKQRNHACQTLLEKWAEPFSTFAAWSQQPASPQKHAGVLPDPAPFAALRDTAPLLRQAWRYLMENHPHDSICGCSIDQVHEEMQPRFDQVEQLGEELTRQSLLALAARVDTRAAEPATGGWPLVVFNPHSTPVTGPVSVLLPLPAGSPDVTLTGSRGETAIAVGGERSIHEVAHLVLDRAGLVNLLGKVQGGTIQDYGPYQGNSIQEVRIDRQRNYLLITVTLAATAHPSQQAVEQALPVLMGHLQDPELTTFTVQVLSSQTALSFIARDVPPLGYKTYWARTGGDSASTQTQVRAEAERIEIHNEFFSVTVGEDGTFTLKDLRSGAVYTGLNRFVDGADCGDEYNYAPPADDLIVDQAAVRSIRAWQDPTAAGIELSLQLDVPARLEAGRKHRSSEIAPLMITTRAVVYPGVPRLDFRTRVENHAEDHRLRVHFPAPFLNGRACFDGHFEIVERDLSLPETTPVWSEQPRPEKPQRAFTGISAGELGLTVANLGLPEVAVLAGAEPGTSEIALTLLRCVGWLSRDDFPARRGHAGPGIFTPGAQMPGVWAFDYSVIPHRGDLRASLDLPDSAAHQAYAFQSPLRAVVAAGLPGHLPAAGSFVSCSPASFQISAVKGAEDGRGWIVRGVNLSGDLQQVRLACAAPAGAAWLSNLAEQRLERLAPEADGSYVLEVRGHQILTLRFDPES